MNVTLADRMALMNDDGSQQIFAGAAEQFGLWSAPIAMRLITAPCNGERNVWQLLEPIDAMQPNPLQHLCRLYRFSILSRRRAGKQVCHNLCGERAGLLRRKVCKQITSEIDGDSALPRVDRLLPNAPRA